MYTNVSVAKPGKNAGTGGDKKDKLVLFDWDDVITTPARDSKGIVITDNFVLKPGAFMITIYGTQDTIKHNAAVEGGPDQEGIIQQVDFDHPGDEIEIREFRSNWVSRNIGCFIQRCSNNRKNQFGTPCAPLKLSWKADDDKDKCVTSFTLKSAQKGPDYADYQGTFTFDTVKGTPAAGAVTVDVAAGEGQYQLTTGVAAAAALTGLTNPVEGGTYTLLGSGGAYPSTIAAAGNWLLKSGTAWTALAGSSITFKAFKDGAASFKFLEVSRT